MTRRWIHHHVGGPCVRVILPVHNEQANLPRLYQRLNSVLSQCACDWTLVFVDDGSSDGSPEWLAAASASDRHVAVITLTRNFGHQAAVTVGIQALRKMQPFDVAIVMDTDLQDPPELIPGLIHQWQSGSEIVHAVRRNRREIWPKRMAYWAFYRLYKALAEVDVPLDSGDFCLISAPAVAAINSLPEANRFHRGLRAYVGFRQTTLPYDRPKRHAGLTKYSFSKLIQLAFDGLVSFSSLPLRLVSLMGLFTLLVSVAILGWVLADAWLGHTAPRGWASLAALVLFSGSVQMIALGIVGEYLRQIFLETKKRPSAIVASTTGIEMKTFETSEPEPQPDIFSPHLSHMPLSSIKPWSHRNEDLKNDRGMV